MFEDRERSGTDLELSVAELKTVTNPVNEATRRHFTWLSTCSLFVQMLENIMVFPYEISVQVKLALDWVSGFVKAYSSTTPTGTAKSLGAI